MMRYSYLLPLVEW